MAPSTSFARSTGSTYSFSTSTRTRPELLDGRVGRVAQGRPGAAATEGGRACAAGERAHGENQRLCEAAGERAGVRGRVRVRRDHGEDKLFAGGPVREARV